MSTPLDEARERAKEAKEQDKVQDRGHDPTSKDTGQNHNQDQIQDRNEDPDRKEVQGRFKRDDLGNVVERGGLKDQLNDKAREEWVREVKERNGDGGKKEGIVDKVLSAIPGVNTLLHKSSSASEDQDGKDKKEGEERDAVPPRRPEHDVQVEQFLRGQYHSRSGDGMPEVGSSDK